MAGRLEELAAPDVATVLGPDAAVVVPIGAVEQHGPHLPLAVDHLIATAVADAVVERAEPELAVWTVPTLPYSKSDEHAWAPGTIWLSRDTMVAVLDDLAAGVAAAGATRLVFLNGHGGNSALLQVACREARRRHGLMTFVVHPVVPAATRSVPIDPDGEAGMGIHAGHVETSLMLHLRPELVDMTRARRSVPRWPAGMEHVRFGGATGFGWLSDDLGVDGVIGDPTTATAEAGERLFDEAVASVLAQLREVVAFSFPEEGRGW